MALKKSKQINHTLGVIDISRRRNAKSFKLRVVGRRHLSVSAPFRSRDIDVTHFVEHSAPWIKQQPQWSKVLFTSGDYITPDTKIHFVGQTSPNENDLVVLNDDESGPLSHKTQLLAYNLSIEHLKDFSHKELPNRLMELSKETDLNYSTLRLKNLSSRWGSCSNKENINLNIQIMRLPSNLRDNVMIHELCHTKYLSHSTKFWGLMKQLRPNLMHEKAELKKFQLWRKPTKH